MMMKSLLDACSEAAPAIANHVWQSTLFAAAMGALTLAFRKNQARIRFGLWLAASLKFLIPFSLLINLGSMAGRPRVAVVQPNFYAVMVQAGQPFTGPAPAAHTLAQRPNLLLLLPGALAAIWMCGFVVVGGLWALRTRRVSALMREAQTLVEGREMDALRELEESSGVRKPLPLVVSRGSMEPGIFGIVRPVLIWPEGISEHLPDPHLRSILAHELWHVRRRDNLAAALHMLVEATFWFHPLVWWIGARLVDERERACDEQVLRLGNLPDVYAESILKACRFCVEAPLACVSGVAGSNLKRRIVRIMDRQLGNKLGMGGKLVLAAIAAAVIAGPVAIGVFNSPQARAQEAQAATPGTVVLDEASVRPSTSTGDHRSVLAEANKFSATGATVNSLISMAYGVQEYQLIGGPDWMNTDRFDVDATWKGPSASEEKLMTVTTDTPPPLGSAPPPEAISIRLGSGRVRTSVQALLADKFNLKFRRETRDLPVYDLVVASTGAKLTATSLSPTPRVVPDGHAMIHAMINVRVEGHNGALEFSAKDASPAVLGALLSENLNRRVVNKTGLTGLYDIDFHVPQGQTSAEDISVALEDQLGLRLEPAQAPVDVLVIEQIDKPAAN
jgi:bla regulator protein BlaR1